MILTLTAGAGEVAPQVWGVSTEDGSKMLTGQHIWPSRTGKLPRVIEKPCHVSVPAQTCVCVHTYTHIHTNT